MLYVCNIAGSKKEASQCVVKMCCNRLFDVSCACILLPGNTLFFEGQLRAGVCIAFLVLVYSLNEFCHLICQLEGI